MDQRLKTPMTTVSRRRRQVAPRRKACLGRKCSLRTRKKATCWPCQRQLHRVRSWLTMTPWHSPVVVGVTRQRKLHQHRKKSRKSSSMDLCSRSLGCDSIIQRKICSRIQSSNFYSSVRLKNKNLRVRLERIRQERLSLNTSSVSKWKMATHRC